MSTFAVMVFSDEKSAYEGLRALQELHAAGSLTVYGTDVVQRDEEGALRVLKRDDQGPIGFGLGALLGGLTGMFGGPAGAAIGAAFGGATGSVVDVVDWDVSEEFVERVQRNLSPGKYAVIAEISEKWVAPLDVRMAELGGSVVREEREAFGEELLDRRMSTLRTKLEARKAARARAKAERAAERAGDKAYSKETSLEIEIDDAQWKLKSMAAKAEKRLERMEQELNAKIEALRAQAAPAKPEVRDQIEKRAAEIAKDYAERKQKLLRAKELTREALR
jgi:uncharacterized membrane protein